MRKRYINVIYRRPNSQVSWDQLYIVWSNRPLDSGVRMERQDAGPVSHNRESRKLVRTWIANYFNRMAQTAKTYSSNTVPEDTQYCHHDQTSQHKRDTWRESSGRAADQAAGSSQIWEARQLLSDFIRHLKELMSTIWDLFFIQPQLTGCCEQSSVTRWKRKKFIWLCNLLFQGFYVYLYISNMYPIVCCPLPLSVHSYPEPLTKCEGEVHRADI